MVKLVDSATLYHTGNDLTTFTHSESDILAPKVPQFHFHALESLSVPPGDLSYELRHAW